MTLHPSDRLGPLENAGPDTLAIHEIYASIQGESTHAGKPCTFIRTTACHLRCGYCDTAHAFLEGSTMPIDDIVAEVRTLKNRLVLVTGGEPLLQPAVHALITRLCDDGYEVLVETSGSLDISPIDERAACIMDLKTPGSRELEANLYENVERLKPNDEIKLVLTDRADYDWAVEMIRRHDLPSRCTVLMGVAWGMLDSAELAQWILEDHLPVRLQLQAHKHIWDPKKRGV